MCFTLRLVDEINGRRKKNARACTQNERIVVGAARMRTTALGTLNKIRNKLTRKMSCRYFECARARLPARAYKSVESFAPKMPIN